MVSEKVVIILLVAVIVISVFSFIISVDFHVESETSHSLEKIVNGGDSGNLNLVVETSFGGLDGGE